MYTAEFDEFLLLFCVCDLSFYMKHDNSNDEAIHILGNQMMKRTSKLSSAILKVTTCL